MLSSLVHMLNKNHIEAKPKQNAFRGINRLSPAMVEQILQDYKDPTIKLKDISQKHRASVAVIIALARQAGVAHRSRGRRPALEPSDFQRDILTAARTETFEAVGRRFGRTR